MVDNASFSTPRTSFMGESVDASSLLIRYTWVGDNNLDGKVDVENDGLAFLVGLNGSGTGWSFGDYNYDGMTDVENDGLAFLIALNTSGGAAQAPAFGRMLSAASVPSATFSEEPMPTEAVIEEPAPTAPLADVVPGVPAEPAPAPADVGALGSPAQADGGDGTKATTSPVRSLARGAKGHHVAKAATGSAVLRSPPAQKPRVRNGSGRAIGPFYPPKFDVPGAAVRRNVAASILGSSKDKDLLQGVRPPLP